MEHSKGSGIDESIAITLPDDSFAVAISIYSYACFQNSKKHGFWDDLPRNKAEMIALMHSELSECLEAIRKPDMKDSHLPHISAEVVELADVFIRLMDYIGGHELEVEFVKAVNEKMAFNESRPPKHNKEF